LSRRRREVFDLDGVEHATDLRAQGRVERRGFECPGRIEAREFAEVLAEGVSERRA
jgi:hypothetical protein